MTQPTVACADPRGCHAVVACVSPCGTDLLAEVDRQVRAQTAEHRAAVLDEAIKAAEGELLQDDTGMREDEAYNQGVHDVIVALRRMAEEART
ncbi:hypothetical protein ACFVIY_17910 [Streptomyces sp. NPDC127166]|uniref:hypothetical protein n=1 Tax=Streptomyces sp. NPDC127166 TaxID=3345380 RepID=UPI00362A2765